MDYQEQATECFQKIKTLRNINQISKIIDEYRPIQVPLVEPYRLIKNISSGQQVSQTNNFYEEQEIPFVPSIDLMKSYQQNFSKAKANEKITNTTNYKLKASFGNPAPKKNTNSELRSNQRYEGVGYQGNSMESRWVMVEDKEENMLSNLKSKQIEATLPMMENTLLKNQLQNLNKKDVNIANYSLENWKQMRQKLTHGLNIK